MEVDEEQIYTQHFAWGLPVVLSVGLGLAAWYICSGAVLMSFVK
jgi:hypothetical protein